MAQCVLLTEPKGDGEEADYQVRRTSAFGYPVPMEHLGIELSMTEFGAYSDIKPHRWT
ncbi:hypothetical protein AB5J49_15975 [Streptomyces sp. R28]|uniref:Uncharacterized protein n=1 Tax=Streptomyces sp. R28 TaxID=3238628 RepID=A0AB39PZY5_9ACTN